MLVQNEARRNAVAGDFKAASLVAAECSRLSRQFRARFGDGRNERKKKLPSPCYMEIMTTRVDLNQHRCEHFAT